MLRPLRFRPGHRGRRLRRALVCTLGAMALAAGCTSVAGLDELVFVESGAGGSTATTCQEGDCAACYYSACAAQHCSALATACAQQQACFDITTCWHACLGTPACNDWHSATCTACVDGCKLAAPDGEPTWTAMMTCVICEACYSDCDGEWYCSG
jgi:hypothetical protein